MYLPYRITVALIVALSTLECAAQFPTTPQPPTPGGGYRPPSSRTPSYRPPTYNNRASRRPTVPSYKSPTVDSLRNRTPSYNQPNYSSSASKTLDSIRNRYSPSNSLPSTSFGTFSNPLLTNEQYDVPGVPTSFGRTHFQPARVQLSGLVTDLNGHDPFANIHQQKNRNQARTYIDRILQKNRNLTNMMSAVEAAQRGRLSIKEVSAYRTSAIEMARQQINQNSNLTATPFVALAKYSLEDSNMDQFRQYTGELRNRFPKDKHTRLFNGIDLLDKKNWKAAEKELLAAKEAGIPEKDLAAFLKMAIDNQKWIWEYAMIIGCLILAWLVGMFCLYFVGRYLSLATLKTLKNDPNTDFSRQRSLNLLYRFVVFFAGVYYYGSLPIVVILAIALPLTLAYAALSLPIISFTVVGIVLAGSLGGIVTAFSGLRASFAKIEDRDFDRLVTRDEAPQLWTAVEDVADDVGTRAVDEIWLLPGDQIGVLEKGTLVSKLRDRAKRVLVMGAASIDGMDTGAFRSILAHEYGHFHNRDTAGGDISLRVKVSMEKFVQSILKRGKIRWWDVAVKFLSVYFRMFHRMTLGASRMQEIMADRIAVKSFGWEAFQRGLTHSTRRSFESAFEQQQQRNRILFGYDSRMYVEDKFSPMERLQIFQAVETANAEETSEYDTHPCLKERLAYSSLFDEQGTDPGDDEIVWSLFQKPNDVKVELESQLESIIENEIRLQSYLNSQNLPLFKQAFAETKNPALMVEAASLQAEAADFDNALSDLEKAIQVSDSRSERLQIEMYKANLQLKMKDDLGALDTLLTSAIENEPDEQLRGEYFILLSVAYARNGDLEQAKQSLADAEKIQQDSYLIEYRFGMMEMQSGNFEIALNRFDRARDLCEQAPEPHLYRGLMLMELGNRDQAKLALRQCLKLDKSNEKASSALQQLLDNFDIADQTSIDH